MKKANLFLFFLISLIICSSVGASEVNPGELFHITGCENGSLVVPTVNIWNKPGGLIVGAMVVGQLSGDGRADQGLKCQGSVVKALELKEVDGRTYIKIKTIVGSRIGWVTDSFVGRRFKRSQCKTFFKDPIYQDECLKK